MLDISSTIVPKSDQLNAEDFISGPLTFTVLDVSVSQAPEQPVSIRFAGGFRPWKPCKTMRRVLVVGWGPNAEHYIGRSLTLFRDPSVKWAGKAEGGIRISAMSDIRAPMEIMLSETKGKRTLQRVAVLQPGDIPQTTDALTIARNLAKNAKGRGWTNDQIKAAMQGKDKIEDMTPEELGRFLRDLQHEPGTISKPDGEETP